MFLPLRVRFGIVGVRLGIADFPFGSTLDKTSW